MAAQGTLAPAPWFTGLDSNGAPLSGAKLFTYMTGTSTKLASYTDAALSVAHANPIILDSAGRAVIYLSPTSYKFVLAPSTDSDPPLSPIKTVDPVNAIPVSADELDIQGTAGETLAAGDGVALSDGTGGQTAGRWYKWDADFPHLSTTANALGMMPAALATGVSGAIRIVGRVTGLSALSPSVLYYVSATAGALTSSPPANARAVAVADTSTSVILSQFIPIPPASATAGGIVILGAQQLGTGTKTVDGLVVNAQPTAKQGTSATANITVGGVIFADTGPRANSGSGETDLSTTSFLANSLSANSKGIKVYAWGTCANSAGSKIIRLYFGATSVLGTLATLTASTAAERWYVEYILQRRDATNQRAIGRVQTDENGLAVVNRIVPASPAETLSGAVTIRSTGQAAGGGASDIVQEGFYIEALG